MTAGGPRPAATGRHELILYATPTGPLAEAVARYETAVRSELAPTAAQTYPPHCTLTGFFRRDRVGAAAAAEEMGRAVREAGPVPAGAVEVVGLLVTDSWVGLELRSPWLLELAASIAGRHRPGPGDDPLRLKDWLHLSLAYGPSGHEAGGLADHARLAERLVDPGAEVGWEVALWERQAEGTWSRLTVPPRAASSGAGTARLDR